MKKLTAIVLAIVMIATLGACSLFNSDSPDSTPSPSPTGSADVTPTPPDDTPDPIIPNLPNIDENPVSDFEYKAIIGGIEITKYIGTAIRVRIPELIEGVPVISIGDRAFANTGIMEVIIPETVTNIGRSAFSGNEALTTLTMLGNNELRTGDLIHFAGIFWRILVLEADKALIITEDVIERRPYHTNGGDITWEFSSIRNYLNNEFFNNFNLVDQNRILETNVINSDNPEYGTPGGNNTTDKIFLLSIDEALTYFADNSERIALNSSGETSWWWLRSPGVNSDFAAYVYDGGDVGIRGDEVDGNAGVRPALWLNLES
ncbi:MAG: leucine-rich repeat domain-containing protein [Oscillospiraceae bacterium]|jgi:hypothetical protein|nr:leucine-rich repeat domain-containing protein [Oscillospiraceae bacterium]